MRTAYINKENKVVYIAAFAEDAIKENTKGKLLFGGSAYDSAANKWTHKLGSGEEVFEIDGSGLSVGDIYTPPTPPETPPIEEQIAQKEGEVQALEKQLALDYLAEQTAQSPEFADYIAQKAESAQ